MDPGVEVLIAEDEPVSQRLLMRTLESWGYKVILAHDGAEAWRLLQAPEAPGLAIIDWEMPGLDGTEVCRRLKAHVDKRHTYVIMLTSRDAASDIVTAMDAGADDFVEKPFRSEELRVRLRAGHRIVEMQAELRRKASHDDLTGIFNRRIVLEMLGRELHRAVRDHKPLAVALLDLDHFKRVNDTYGHQAGDLVLREAAVRISSSIRASDVAGRYGGEEFLIVMPRCDEETSLRVAERVRAVIGGTPVLAADQAIDATVSIGVAATAAAATTTPKALIGQADAALYRAKEAGRNRVELNRAD
ncbi:MAG: diguanylate cyclase [Vicinamibacterales bacterium]